MPGISVASVCLVSFCGVLWWQYMWKLGDQYHCQSYHPRNCWEKRETKVSLAPQLLVYPQAGHNNTTLFTDRSAQQGACQSTVQLGGALSLFTCQMAIQATRVVIWLLLYICLAKILHGVIPITDTGAYGLPLVSYKGAIGQIQGCVFM